MDNSVNWISDDEVVLLRNGHVERSASIDKSDSSEVIVTERIELEENGLKKFLNMKAQEFEDALNFVQCCGFCEKTNEEVSQLIAGPTTMICNECIALCSDIVAEEAE